MSLTETPDAPVKRKPHRRANRRRKKPADAAAPKPAGELAGLTVKDCPSACNAAQCVISGINICSHPAKGALQVHSAGAVDRFNEAKRLIGKRKIELVDAV